MISRMQLPREMYGKGGLTSLREARTVLERHAPRGEFLAYINSDEAALLKSRGGSGEVVNESGIKSYRSLRRTFNKFIPKEITRTLDKIVPNEIKPFLPYIAAAVPFLLPTTGLFASSMARALAGAGANAFSQLSQEGAEKYGINPISVGLSGLSGYLSGPGTGADLASGKIVGNVPTNIQSGVSNISGIDDLAQLGYAGTSPVTQGMITAGQGIPTSTDLSVLQKAENFARGIGEYGAETFKKANTAVEDIASGNIMDVKLGDVGNIAKAAGPSVIGAAGDQAYLDASKALDEYNKQQQAMGQLGVANTEGRKAAIRRAMGLAGYTPDEIDTTILKFNFADGGRVGYQQGGLGSMDPMLALQRSPIDQYGYSDPVISALTGNIFTSGQRFRDVFSPQAGLMMQQAQAAGYSEPEMEELRLQHDFFPSFQRSLNEAYFGPTFQADPQKSAIDLATSIYNQRFQAPPSVQQQRPQTQYQYSSRGTPILQYGYTGTPSVELQSQIDLQKRALDRLESIYNKPMVNIRGDEKAHAFGGTGGMTYNQNELLQNILRSEQEASARVKPKMADGGLMNLRMGGMPAEMDLRAKGGFVPIGRKERADDVPARLSKNEFVFTAKAVRNAGGGDVRKGAKRMYQIMNQLEARS